jgi:glycine cleavage system H protein
VRERTRRQGHHGDLSRDPNEVTGDKRRRGARLRFVLPGASDSAGGTMPDESYPAELKYFKEHDWVRVEGGEATFGITWWAQDALGDMVYASLPDVGAAVSSGQPYGELESVKSVAEIYAPVSGEVVAANDALVAEPALVNADPYGQGWLIRVRLSAPSELDGLMDAAAYRKFLATAGS